MMTREEYLKKRAEKDAELAKQGIGCILDDPLDEEYYQQTVMEPLIRSVGLTVAEMYNEKFGISVRKKMEYLFDENREKFDEWRFKLHDAITNNQPITNWENI